MKRKVMEINENGMHLVCIKDDAAKCNPYRLYHVWYNMGWHRKQMAKYEDFNSILWHIHNMMLNGWRES